jgi:hypothetical protein
MVVNPILLRKQYIGHASHVGPYVANSLRLYTYLVEELKYHIVEADVVFTNDGVPVLNHSIFLTAYIDGEKEILNINQTNYTELLRYSIESEDNIQITTVADFVKFGRESKICIMLDLTFQTYSINHYRKLYEIVKENNMLDSTIWGDPDIIKLAIIDRNLICQFGGSWGRKLLLLSFLKSFFCHTTIMSFSYYGGDIESFARIPKLGHRLGFIMKVATINDIQKANEFWKIDTDLINTDILLNQND